jgi:hypothetical protein
VADEQVGPVLFTVVVVFSQDLDPGLRGNWLVEFGVRLVTWLLLDHAAVMTVSSLVSAVLLRNSWITVWWRCSSSM